MDAIGIDKKAVEKAITEGMKWKEKDSEKWRANMAGVECVFIKKENTLFVITIYEN